jgi:hypothetical protein
MGLMPICETHQKHFIKCYVPRGAAFMCPSCAAELWVAAEKKTEKQDALTPLERLLLAAVKELLPYLQSAVVVDNAQEGGQGIMLRNIEALVRVAEEKGKKEVE